MKKYLVIGNPIDHSLSPKLHNYWIKKNKIDAIYEKKLLAKDDLEKIRTLFGHLEGVGLDYPGGSGPKIKHDTVNQELDTSGVTCPNRILVSEELNDKNTLQIVLSEFHKKKINIRTRFRNKEIQQNIL